MSVLIKGMDVPNVCGQCKIAKAIQCNGWKYIRSIQLDRWKYCPLVEVPTPHGDLIDREELFRLAAKRLHPSIQIGQVRHIAYNILPTVIESEEENE